MSTELTLYYRENCHLCDSMRRALVAVQAEYDIKWHEIDIDRDFELIRLYDALVPVLKLEEQEICHHFFDESALLQAISA